MPSQITQRKSGGRRLAKNNTRAVRKYSGSLPQKMVRRSAEERRKTQLKNLAGTKFTIGKSGLVVVARLSRSGKTLERAATPFSTPNINELEFRYTKQIVDLTVNDLISDCYGSMIGHL